MYQFLLILLQDDAAVEAFGEMIGGILFLVLLIGVIIWGISKLFGKRKK